ncbi:hypothetical protein LPJ71_001122, partial [Coemansia sp. S17]
MAGKSAHFPTVVASRQRQFSSTPISCSTSDKSNGGHLSDISGYTDQLNSEAEYPLILKVMQATLESVHDGPMACPWWGIIAGSAFALRTLLILPVHIYQQRAQARARKLAGISKLWYRPMRASLELELATRTPPVTDKEFGQLLSKRLSRRHHLL